MKGTCGRCSRRLPTLFGASSPLWCHFAASADKLIAIATDAIVDRKQNSHPLLFPAFSSQWREGVDIGPSLSGEVGSTRCQEPDRRHQFSVRLYPNLVFFHIVIRKKNRLY